MNVVVIDYVSCNWDSLLFVSFIIPAMVCLIIIVKVVSYSEYYNSQNILVPMFYYFGDTSIVKNRVEHILDIINTGGDGTSSVPVESMTGMDNVPYTAIAGEYHTLSEIMYPITHVWTFILQTVIRVVKFGTELNSYVVNMHDTRREKMLVQSANIHNKMFIDFIEPAWRKCGKP